MTRRIFYDGRNLALERGTGIATYARMLVRVARQLEFKAGIVCSSPLFPVKDPTRRKATLLDAETRLRLERIGRVSRYALEHFRYYRPIRPVAIDGNGSAADRWTQLLPAHDSLFTTRGLFENATVFFRVTGNLVDLDFADPPDLFHWTYQLPIRAKKTRNIYTIHDLVPLRLPFATVESKRRVFRLLQKIVAGADHIVTVSENSRRDIIELLGVDERRVTNTYQAVEFPREYAGQSKDAVAERLAAAFGLDYQGYLLFFGALEPKKNVGRLIEAYRRAGVRLPLVLVAGGGWKNAAELRAIAAHNATLGPHEPRIVHLDFVDVATLVTLIMGARAVLAPSLFEGFGLPVAEAMSLGTPVVTSRGSSLSEIAGDAALLVDPTDPGDIARAIKSIVADADLCAELARRGLEQAKKFSVERYQERVKLLYDALA